jgi:hypothetical protein
MSCRQVYARISYVRQRGLVKLVSGGLAGLAHKCRYVSHAAPRFGLPSERLMVLAVGAPFEVRPHPALLLRPFCRWHGRSSLAHIGVHGGGAERDA